MPAFGYQTEDKKDATGYRCDLAASWTVTDEGLEAARQLRRQAAQDNGFWNTQKRDLGRFAKDEQKAAQRMEKATTIWLRHFEDVGPKSILHMPSELAQELDLVFGAMYLA